MALNLFANNKKTSAEIRNKSFEESINRLTLHVDGLKSGETDAHIKTLLKKSYHNYRLATGESLEVALSDVLSAIELDGNRFQSYLLAALILFSMKRWLQSLKMFEQSIRLNADVFTLVANKLIFLKFKILTSKGYNEELSLKNAMTYRYLSECVENMTSDSEDRFQSYVQQLICFKGGKDSDSYLNECLNRVNTTTSESSLKKSLDLWKSLHLDNSLPIENQNQISNRNTPQAFDSFVSKLFSSGDQNVIGNKNVYNRPIGSPKRSSLTVSPDRPLDKSPAKTTCSDTDSLELEFKDILRSEVPKRVSPKSIRNENQIKRTPNENSIQTWIDNNFRSDTVSKLCSFEEPIEEPVKEPIGFGDVYENKSIRSRHSSITELQNNENKQPMSEMYRPIHQPATNLLKLRGVYIGNLKPNCDHKKLKDIFKAYGTIVEMYQPSGADYAFIHYKIHESATNMLNEWKFRQLDQCKDNKPLIVRFTASQEQMKKFNSMSYSDYKKRCNEFHECERWRSGQHCPYDKNCPFKHLYINRAVDTLPDKRKINWKLI